MKEINKEDELLENIAKEMMKICEYKIHYRVINKF